MINCLFVDDKPLALDLLLNYAARMPVINVVLSTTDPLKALAKIAEGNIDLVFLDIQMPELNGLQFIKLIAGKCQVVFTTAYAEHALEGYELNAADYLLKPISFERFDQAIEKVMVILKGLGEPITAFVNQPSTVKQSDYIFVKTEHKLFRVNTADILYVEGLQNYVTIHTAKEKIISLQTMKKLEEILPQPQFMRVHKSFIISLNKIVSIERNRIQIGGIHISLGEVYREAFYNTIN